MNTIPLNENRFKKIIGSPVFTYGVFWSWNLLYLILFSFLEIETGFAYSVVFDGLTGSLPANFMLSALMIYCIPLLSITLALTIWRRQHRKLLKLFYGAEVPLTLFFMLRVCLIRELNSGSAHLMLLFVAGMFSYLFFLFREKHPELKLVSLLYVVLKSATFLIGLYIGLLLTGYVIPLSAISLKGLLQMEWTDVFEIGGIVLIGFLFFCYSLTLFLGLPFALMYLYARSYIQYMRFCIQRYSPAPVYGTAFVFFLLNIGLYVYLNWTQSQEKAFAFLDKKEWSPAEIDEFYAHEPMLKRGLVNAHLAPYRYLTSTSENNIIAGLCREAFGGETGTYEVAQLYNNALLKPFLYDGNFYEDQQKAAVLYEQYFEKPIQKDQRAALQSAVNATWERAQAEAGVMDIDEEKVLVTKQDITIREHGQYADIELYEQYQNQTFNQQEILYYFSLPENAVITGLWLSDDSIPKKYTYRVSPRGAAQQVYTDIVSVRQDPSLLEQTGPGMYRLRAFPILPKSYDYIQGRSHGAWSRSKTLVEGTPFHLWLSYRVLNDGSGSWPLPSLLEKRNAYVTDDTHYSVNNVSVEKEDTDAWLPPSIAAVHAEAPLDLILSLQDGTVLKSSVRKQTDIPVLPDGSYAVLIDGSYSMKQYEDKTKQIIQTLLAASSPSLTMDVYLTGKKPQRLQHPAAVSMDYFGRYDQLELLSQFDSLRTHAGYTSVLMLTDEGSYETSSDSLDAPGFSCPLYLLQVNGQKSYSYPDALIETVEAGHGKITTSLEEAIGYIAIRQQTKTNTSLVGMDAFRIWTLDTGTATSPSPMSANAAGVYISYLADGIRAGGLSGYDRAHALAMQNGIVSVYSSMIVLVDEQQQKQLDELEHADDRFKRETENGTELISKPASFGNVSGTPEPEEWLLIIIAGIILVYSYLKKRRIAFG